jgi:hypothetical protein
MFHFAGDTIVVLRLLIPMKHKEIDGHGRTGDNRSILTLHNKIPFLVKMRLCTDMLAIYFYLSMFLIIINIRSHLRCLIFLDFKLSPCSECCMHSSG